MEFEFPSLEFPWLMQPNLWITVWDPDKVIDIWRWSIYGGGRLERFLCPEYQYLGAEHNEVRYLYYIIYIELYSFCVCNISHIYILYIIMHCTSEAQ